MWAWFSFGPAWRASIKLNSTDGSSLEVLGLGGSVEGRSFEIQPTDDGTNPRVRITWNEGEVVQTTTFNHGYGMKLEFSRAIKRKVSGKIYLCLPDDPKSYVVGTFSVRVPEPK